MNERMTSDELQEALVLLENFTVTSGLTLRGGKRFSWKDIIHTLRERIAELEKEWKTVREAIEEKIEECEQAYKAHPDGKCKACCYITLGEFYSIQACLDTPSAESKEAADASKADK